MDSGLRVRVRNDASTLWRVLSACLLASTLWVYGPASAAEPRDADQHFFNLNTGDLKAEAHDAKQAGKKALFFMFEQEGCPGCLHMKRNVLNRGDVQAYYRERFVNFSIDIHGAVPLRDFAGRDFTEQRYAQTLRINATPTLVFFDLDGNEIARVIGPVKDAAEFLLLGEFVASGAYRSSRFADYKQVHRKRRGG